jgi:hypothetical protein
VEPEKTSIARQWLGKQIQAATDMHATIEELLEMAFYMWPMLKLYNENQQDEDSQK